MEMNTIMLMMGGEGGSNSGTLIMMLLIMVVFFFFFIRPQTKKAKEEKKFRENLKNGAKVVTIGGVHGKIIEDRKTTFVLEVEGGGRIKVEKSAISMDSTKLLEKQAEK